MGIIWMSITVMQRDSEFIIKKFTKILSYGIYEKQSYNMIVL